MVSIEVGGIDMLVVKIMQKIKGFKVVNEVEEQVFVVVVEVVLVVQMDEILECLDILIGVIYKIKLLLFEYVFYVIINDMVFNVGMVYEQWCFFEIFINLKNMDYFQWIVVFICIMFVVFCKGGDCIFFVEEFKVVFDLCGGYLKKGGIYMFFIVVEIGGVLECYLMVIGLLCGFELDEEQCFFFVEKCVVYEVVQGISKVELGEGFFVGV